ncbi:hypothetical protein [Flavobacterium sp.]|uniref:hypothetical protein n=1 Tax=Flavobacterium sp. TaxID=239 RepID=UPI0039E35411
MKYSIILAGLLAFSNGFSQQAQNDKPEREAFTLKVERNAKQFYAQQVERSPYFAMEKTLQLYPYEKVLVEVEIKADTIHSMKTVEKNLNPERTFEIEFCQTVKEHTARPTQLWIKNPFGKKLKYTVLYHSIEDREWRTVSKTARKNWSSNEVWPTEVVSSLVLKDWELE